MKTKFKVLIAAALFIGMGTSAWAQSASLSTTAVVYSALSITKDTDLSFGSLAPSNAAATVSPYASPTHTALLTTPTVGTLHIAGSTGADVKISWTGTVTLNGPGEDDLTCTLNVVGAVTDQPSSGSLSSGAVVTLAGETGGYKLWVGGSLPALAANQTTGTYSGTTTFSVEYN